MRLAQIFKATPKLFWLCHARRAMQSLRATGSLRATQSSHATQSLQSHALGAAIDTCSADHHVQ